MVSTVHLESLDNQKLRFEQLKEISKILNQNPTSLLMGDFNFDSNTNYLNHPLPLENDSLKTILPYHQDIWSKLKKESGFTFDPKKNELLKGNEEGQMRIDRILIKSKKWIPKTIKLIGDIPFMKDSKKQIFPSDHFGLMTTIEYQ